MFVLVVLSVMIIDTLPFPTRLKLACSPVLNRVGLWQGSWALFAPNPAINNAWLSVDVTAPDGTQQTWNSTYWSETSSWERFRRYRFINYNNRIASVDKAAADNFADYMACQLISPDARPLPATESEETANSGQNAGLESHEGRVWRLSVYRNLFTLSLPEDGSFPLREEAIWLSTSRNLTLRQYLP
jgi:hypothetical protein